MQRLEEELQRTRAELHDAQRARDAVEVGRERAEVNLAREKEQHEACKRRAAELEVKCMLHEELGQERHNPDVLEPVLELLLGEACLGEAVELPATTSRFGATAAASQAGVPPALPPRRRPPMSSIQPGQMAGTSQKSGNADKLHQSLDSLQDKLHKEASPLPEDQRRSVDALPLRTLTNRKSDSEIAARVRRELYASLEQLQADLDGGAGPRKELRIPLDQQTDSNGGAGPRGEHRVSVDSLSSVGLGVLRHHAIASSVGSDALSEVEP